MHHRHEVYLPDLPARPLAPPDEPWICRNCGHPCDAWHCQICREVQCGHESASPVEVVTLNDGRKLVCLECAAITIEDCAVRDLREARRILSDIFFSERGELDSEEVAFMIGHAIEYVDRKTAEEIGIGYTEFFSRMLSESITALKKPIGAEAHCYECVYAERFGKGANHA